jgi:thioredoxin reductase (NADPH)
MSKLPIGHWVFFRSIRIIRSIRLIMTENVIIIGGGPAGLSSAIYLARAGLEPLVFTGSPPGGQLSLTSEVENYPGFESILGSELIEKIRKQALKFGTRIRDENVINVDFSKTPFIVGNDSHVVPKKGEHGGSPLQSKSVIIATGAKALWLNLPSEQRLWGKGVSACATCDGFFFKDKTVAVVGGGNTALEEALTLTKFAKKVYIIHRRDFFRASKIMQDRVFADKKIEVIWNSLVEEIMGEKKVEGIKLKIKNEKLKILNLDGVFVAIGHKPDTDLFKGKVELDEKGYIKIFGRRSTSVSGVFAAGDCADPYYRQAITAAGTGVEAALEVERWLKINS